MAWTMGLPESAKMSFDDDDVSSKRIALSATLTSWSFLTTLLTMSSLVMISTANDGVAMSATRTPPKTPVQIFDLSFIAFSETRAHVRKLFDGVRSGRDREPSFVMRALRR